MREDGHTVKPEDVPAAFGGEPRHPMSVAAEAWLQDQGQVVLYRGSKVLAAGEDFLSDVATGRVIPPGDPDYPAGTVAYRKGGTPLDASLDASRQLAADLAAWHEAHLGGPNPMYAAELRGNWHLHLGSEVAKRLPPGVRDSFIQAFGTTQVGGAGIPFSKRIGIAGGYAQKHGEALYATLQAADSVRGPVGAWGRVFELEYVALHQVKADTVVHMIPPGGIQFMPPF
jgi:hypothetical protein